MSELDKIFKDYHNANYHDGDPHFDERVYAKSNGDDFDSDFIEDCHGHFEAAWNHQQKKIDELKGIIKMQECGVDEIKNTLGQIYDACNEDETVSMLLDKIQGLLK